MEGLGITQRQKDLKEFQDISVDVLNRLRDLMAEASALMEATRMYALIARTMDRIAGVMDDAETKLVRMEALYNRLEEEIVR